MKKIKLYGHLADKYGEEFKFDVKSPMEACQALQCNFPDFLATLGDGNYRVGYREDDSITAEAVIMVSENQEIHIEPMLEGSISRSGKTVISIALGVVLAATGFGAFLAPGVTTAAAGGAIGTGAAVTIYGTAIISYGSLALLGISLIASGIYAALVSQPSTDSSDPTSPDRRTSFLLGGRINTFESGSVRPVVYGDVRVGSVVVGSGLDVVDIAV